MNSYELEVPRGRAWIDIDLPEIKGMPSRSARVAANGKRLLVQPLSKRTTSAFYARHVHGIAMRACGLAFTAPPSIKTCVVGGFTQRTDPATGLCIDTYLLSVVFDRAQFGAINFNAHEQVDPVASVGKFTVRRSMTTTGLMRPIITFQHQDLA
ncbi:MAG: hypothetical protein K9L70_08015 [Thiohalocapsa sp.]|nr:hypothetical protein [Thiohalocapsa sp.]MCF7990478.1 hypothetical protein [Thiohalocapsa sp.]